MDAASARFGTLLIGLVLARLMGPTGNLRAPTARVGTTLMVGFNEEAYAEVLG